MSMPTIDDSASLAHMSRLLATGDADTVAHASRIVANTLAPGCTSLSNVASRLARKYLVGVKT